MDPDPAYNSRVGQIIGGKYRVLRLVGAGGMGAVYEAENAWIKRRVAIKVLRPELLRSNEAVQRFTQEAQAATSIEHPNIVYVLDMGQEPSDGSLYIVQEYLTGIDLRRRLEHDKRLSVQEVLSTLVPIMSALMAAHDRGIVHRDIKPENIFLSRGTGGEIVPKLIDFGVSKIMDAAGALAKTQTGTALGTPYYMSPEQGRGDSTIDARTDVWSVGAVLFELLAGAPPFDAANYNLLVLKILTERPPRIETMAPGIPADLAAIVHGALEPDRDRRFASMRDFRDALQNFAASRPDLGIVTGVAQVSTMMSGSTPQSATVYAAPSPVTPSQARPVPAAVANVTGAIAPNSPVSIGVGAPVAPMQSNYAGVAPSGAMAGTALGWAQPAAPTRSTPWLLFMAVAAISVFAGAATVVFIRGRPRAHAAAAAHTAIPNTALPLPPVIPVTDGGGAVSAVPPVAGAALAPVVAPVADAPPDTANARVPGDRTPTGSSRGRPPPRFPTVAPAAPTPLGAVVTRPAPAPPTLPPGYFAPVAAAPIPPPRRVVPQPADPVVQQANSAATQLAYNAQQVGYSDPRRARRMMNFSNDIHARVDRVRALELEAAQYDSVDPRRAAHARDVAARRREELQRFVERAQRE